MSRNVLILVLCAALAGAAISTLLLFQHYAQADASSLVNMLCGGSNSTSGCEKVNRSSYSSVAGFPLAAWGIVFYLSISLLIALSLFADERLRAVTGQLVLYFASAAFLADLFLLAVQIFSIGSFCILCISTYIVTAIIIGMLFRHRKLPEGVSRTFFFGSGLGKMLFVAWVAGSLFLFIAVFASNYAMSYKDPVILDERLTESAYTEYQNGPVREFDLSGIPGIGNPNAPVKVVIFSDFLCPYCRQTAQFFKQYLPLWPNKVVLYYISYPLDKACNVYQDKMVHAGSCWVALGGVCAQEQGKFWLYHDYVFDQGIVTPGFSTVLNFGLTLRLDTAAFKNCLLSLPDRNILGSQIEKGHSAGVDATPKIFINGRLLPRLGYLNAIMEKEAERLGVGPLEGLEK